MSVITVEIPVPQNSEIVQNYTRIKVYRSTTGEGGAYTELTGASDSPPTILGSTDGPFDLDGLALTISFNLGLVDWTINFDQDGIGAATVLSEVEDGVDTRYVTPYTSGAKFGIKGADAYGYNNLALSGTACAVLGLSTTRTYGAYSRIVMYEPLQKYFFRDWDGNDSYWYKTSFYHHLTSAESSLSDPIPGAPPTKFPTSEMSLGSGHLTDLAGKPIQNKTIRFRLEGQAAVTAEDATPTRWWIPPNSEFTVLTDYLGGFSTYLPKGASVSVAVEGTSMVRTLEVPDTDFDVFWAAGATTDRFQVVTPAEVYLVRRAFP
jgi:hypothetical protein